MKEVAVKAKHKTKSHILGLFRSGGKKAAGARGDVSVDGKGKRVGQDLEFWFKVERGSHGAVVDLLRLEPRSTRSYSEGMLLMMAI
jgi:hypothetical protein